jgi:hypothetical protein
MGFEPHKDEILLFYGLVGTGRSPVLRALTGVTSAITLAAKTMTPNPSLSTSMIALTITMEAVLTGGAPCAPATPGIASHRYELSCRCDVA